MCPSAVVGILVSVGCRQKHIVVTISNLVWDFVGALKYVCLVFI